MSIEWIEHTADVRVRVRAASVEELFREALRATMSLLRPERGKRRVAHDLAVDAVDQTTLLIDFLNEALSRAQANRETYDDAMFSKLTERRLEARLTGSDALSFGDDVKAVTYHQADVRRDTDGMWETIIVYDV